MAAPQEAVVVSSAAHQGGDNESIFCACGRCHAFVNIQTGQRKKPDQQAMHQQQQQQPAAASQDTGEAEATPPTSPGKDAGAAAEAECLEMKADVLAESDEEEEGVATDDSPMASQAQVV